MAEDVLAFAGIAPPTLRLYPVETHIAEKLHAYTLPRPRPNSRVKDLPDLRVTQDSWVVKSAIASESESKRLINHERTHFLLASCVAFDLYQQILDAKETSSARLQAKLTELRRKAAKRAQDMSDEYDDDTLHGDIAIAQRNWDLRIERWDREQSE